MIEPYSYRLSNHFYYVHTSKQYEVFVRLDSISISFDQFVLAEHTTGSWGVRDYKDVFCHDMLELIISKYRMMGFKCDLSVLEHLKGLKEVYEPANESQNTPA